jgi:uncharacterized integral membrane protein (TIGR00698 family)
MAKLPPEKYHTWPKYIFAVAPGLFAAVFFAYLAWQLDRSTPASLPFNFVFYAILFGILLKNVFRLPSVFSAGMSFSARILLFIGVIFMGGSMNLMKIVDTGLNALLLVIFTITVMVFLAIWIGKKWGVDEKSSHLIGIGAGVCGVSAILALAPVIKAREKHILTAIATVLLTDVFVLFTLPLLVHLSGISEIFAGYWAGAVASNTAQSIATGFAVGDVAGQVATVTKTARNALMAIIVLFFAYYYARRGLPVGAKVSMGLLWDKFPKFVLGFLILSLLTTAGLFTEETVAFFKAMSSWLFAACFVGIGMEINFKEMGRQDFKPIALGFMLIIILAVTAGLFIRFILPT